MVSASRLRITFDFDGDVQFDREILATSERAENMRPVFEHIMDRMEGWEKEQFDTQGRRASGGWAPLKDSTLKRKRAQGQDPRILHATGRLRDALTKSYAPGAIRKADRDSATFGVDPQQVEYSKFHQRGTKFMQRRRPVQFTQEDRREIVRDLQLWVRRGELRP